MVDQPILRRVPRHLKSHGWRDDVGRGHNLWHMNLPETEYQKFTSCQPRPSLLKSTMSFLPQGLLWSRYFLDAQGYGVDDSIVYQDNQSTILLAKNSKASSGKLTQHINIFYSQGSRGIWQRKIVYCPIREMATNSFTKPLQRAQFLKFRNTIMNINPQCQDVFMEDCSRSVLIILLPELLGTVNCEQTRNRHRTDTGWKAVTSNKQNIKSKCLPSHTSTAKTENSTCVNGMHNSKQVKFEEGNDCLILI